MARPERAALLATLEQGVRELAGSTQWTRYLAYQARLRRYSPNNVLLIAAQCPRASQVASFTTWRRLGRAVRRGERAIWILAPVRARRRTDCGEDEERVVAFRAVPVFDVSQTEGEAPPSISVPLAGTHGAERYGALVALVVQRGFCVHDHDFRGAAHGDCDHRTRTVRIERENDPAQRVKTLVHELAHVILHETVDSRAAAELEAESVAFAVCQALGVDSSGYSFGYLASWAGGGEEAVAGLRRSAARIQKATAEILDGLDALEGAPPGWAA